jgi:hypothetical protein
MLVRPGRALVPFLALGLLASGSCADVKDDQPVIAARPGATQQAGDGTELDEDEACARLVAAEKRVLGRLNCKTLERASCQEYVRPAGQGCWTYPEASVAACEDKLGRYRSCAELTDQPCIVTAIPADPALCGGSGVGGQGGEGGGGSGGTSGSSAAGTAGSTSGGAGEAGEGGAPAHAGGQGGAP